MDDKQKESVRLEQALEPAAVAASEASAARRASAYRNQPRPSSSWEHGWYKKQRK
jgi:hypothetical protein